MKRTVWWEPRRRRDTYSVRWYDPATGKAQRLKVDGKLERDREVNRIQKMLLDWKPSHAKDHAVPLVVMESYLSTIARLGRRKTTLEMKRKHLTPILSTVFRMEQITKDFINAWIEGAHKKYKPDTIAIRLRDIRAFVRWAWKESILKENPFDGIKIPESSFVGRRLTREELRSLVDNLEGNARDFVILSLECGVRKGELLQLEYSDIDFERKYWSLPGREGKSKSKCDRVIPLSPLAISTLQNRKLGGSERVFEGYTKDKLRNDLENAKDRAGIKGRLRVHDLRHTWASNFRGRASSLKAIAGWSTDQMMSHYTHVELEELREDMGKSNLLG